MIYSPPQTKRFNNATQTFQIVLPPMLTFSQFTEPSLIHTLVTHFPDVTFWHNLQFEFGNRSLIDKHLSTLTPPIITRLQTKVCKQSSAASSAPEIY